MTRHQPSSGEKSARASFHDLFVHAGLEEPLPPSLTLANIKKAILAYLEETGKRPTQFSGDASKWFGFAITWAGVRSKLYYGGKDIPENYSLYKLCVDLGLASGRNNLTPDKVQKALIAYTKEKGSPPLIKLEDASEWFGFPITWKTVDQRLRDGWGGLPGGSSLPQLCRELGLITCGKDLTKKKTKKAIRAYFKETGKAPSMEHGDATKWLGFKITWKMADYRVRRLFGKSLYNLCLEMGLATYGKNLTLNKIREAIQAYRKEMGKLPANQSGDAERWFGFKIRWATVDHRLRKGLAGLPGGSSLSKLKKEMGLDDKDKK